MTLYFYPKKKKDSLRVIYIALGIKKVADMLGGYAIFKNHLFMKDYCVLSK